MATVAVFIALGGSSYAAITVTGKNVKDSSLTGKDVKNRSLTGKDIKKSSLTTTEVKDRSLLSRDFKAGQLPSGPQGLKGDKGDSATNLFAAVKDDGSLIYGNGAVGSVRNGMGDYTVTFNRALTNCVTFVELGFGDPAGSGGGGPGSGHTQVWMHSPFPLSNPGTASTVQVQTFSSTNSFADSNFLVAALC
jgi:hypothetical protein